MNDVYELSQWIKERDEVIEITMRKMVCCLAKPKKDKLAEARAWLSEHGYSWTI